MLGVLAHRCGWLGPDEREASLHDAYVVLYKALDAGKRAERRLAEPVGDGAVFERAPDPRRGPEAQAEANDRGARVRDLIAELPTRQHAVLKLRYLLDCSPAEIQASLGITRRTYRRQLERTMSTMSERCVRASLRESGERSNA